MYPGGDSPSLRRSRPTLPGMHQIPPDVFRDRIRKWKAQPDRKTVVTVEDGRPVREWWSVGVCRLRMVRYPDGYMLYADKGVPGYPPKRDTVKISFTTWS